MILQYPVDISAAESGRLEVLFGNLPGKAWGQNEADALERAAGALIIILAGYVHAGEPIPPPGLARGRPLVSLPPLEAAKVALHNAMLAAGVSDADLADRLKILRSDVRRLRNLIYPDDPAEVEAALATLVAMRKSQSDVPV